jgi:hypothetical protein
MSWHNTYAALCVLPDVIGPSHRGPMTTESFLFTGELVCSIREGAADSVGFDPMSERAAWRPSPFTCLWQKASYSV